MREKSATSLKIKDPGGPDYMNEADTTGDSSLHQRIERQYANAVSLLKQLIATPSFSREEDKTADILEAFFIAEGITLTRKKNNVWAFNKYFDPAKPTILLNSHHDTVRPNAKWTKNPFEAVEEDGKLFGLGSNDAGGCLVSLIATFLCFYEEKEMAYNLMFAASAEEEISGTEGIELIVPEMGEIEFAIVGEPTEMHMAVAEKGLLVLDCSAHGRAGHAARDEGDNAIYKALKDIEWFRNYTFPKVSETLGPIKMTVTIINAGSQHNVVPDRCQFTVDVRVTDAYTHEEILDVIQKNISSEAVPRSMRMRPSSIAMDHPFVLEGLKMGRKAYGSPTTSDQALLPFASLKMGPGNSARSHTADEFIYPEEIHEGIKIYTHILHPLLFPAAQQAKKKHETLAEKL
jgi:acetylornithine deacetylase